MYVPQTDAEVDALQRLPSVPMPEPDSELERVLDAAREDVLILWWLGHLAPDDLLPDERRLIELLGLDPERPDPENSSRG